MAYSLNEIASIINAEKEISFPALPIEHLLTDSRKLVFADTTLFFALPGISGNGTDFIEALYIRGVRSFVVPQYFLPGSKYPGAFFLKVNDVLASLQQLAARHRSRFIFPVIGITGSNGKTIVKEWLNHLLSPGFDIVRSPKSYNSQVGVPLSVWQMNQVNTLGIFEAGISRPGEMEKLQRIIQPGLGLFTFIGEAHAEGFGSTVDKIAEKLKLFSQSAVLFYCADEELLDITIKKFISETNPGLKTFTWGKTAADVLVEKVLADAAGTGIVVNYLKNQFSFTIPFTDEAAVHNALTCLCVLLHFDIPFAEIKERLSSLKAVEMRLELKQGINDCAIINDSYSADINSLGIALDFLQQQEQHNKRTVVLSDFMQSGSEEKVLYKKIAALLHTKELFRFVGIGEQLAKQQYLFSGIPHIHFYDTTEDFLAQLTSLDLQHETILLKGARKFRFEKISRTLEQKLHETFLEVDLNALRHNFKVYKQLADPGVKIMAMVKALGYGSGSYEVAALLQHAGVDYLGVAYADEGVELRKAGILKPVMVMNTEEAGFDNIVQYNLEPELYSFSIFRSFKNYLKQHNISNYKVHIKLDTGMHRLGFEAADIDELVSEIKNSGEFYIASVFSHLAGSDEASLDGFTKQQQSQFLSMAAKIEATTSYPFIKHIANTSAISRHKDAQLDMVRLGIGLYGVDSNEGVQKMLKNVATLKTTISQIRSVKAGETVGYGRKGTVTKDAVIATVRIGYADGYFRALGNGRGKMLVNANFAPVIGNVCMDMTMLDITGIDAAEGDEVIVFGEWLPVPQLAKWAGTIPYEILTNVSQRVRRVYFEE
ncbi:MAG: bifunctional UDP-N-acetylmuramoyl-tripeptide:D-alanyl-D-alanine ligase/alanine racemase [Ferruginibacter sp.]